MLTKLVDNYKVIPTCFFSSFAKVIIIFYFIFNIFCGAFVIL